MSIDDYITPNTSGEVDGEKKSPRVLAAEVQDANELKRKRDILISLSLEELKSYIGKIFSIEQINNMEKEKLESYFQLYQLKLGQETTNEMMSSLVEMSVKGLSYFVDIDDQEELKNELENNKQLKRTLGKQVGGIAEKYGDVVAFAKLFFTVGKHVSFSPTEKDSAEESKTTPSTNTDSASTNTDSASTNTDSASTNTDSASTMLAQC